MYSTPIFFNICFESSQPLGRIVSLGSSLSLSDLQLVGNKNVQCHLMFIKSTIFNDYCVTSVMKKTSYCLGWTTTENMTPEIDPFP